MGKSRPIQLQAKPNAPVTDEELMAALLEVANGSEVVLYNEKGQGFQSNEPIRARMELLLQQFMEDPAELLLDLLPAPLGRGKTDIAADVLKSVVPKLYLDFLGPRGLSLRTGNYYPDLTSALDYAVLVLLDRGRPSYGAALSRCQLPRCRNFYFAKKNPNGGPPNRLYCCPGHRTEASDKKLNRTRKHK